MPELPEVETYRRDLEPHLLGSTLARVQVRNTPNAPRILRRHGPVGFAEQLERARVVAVGRVGKFLTLSLDLPVALVLHLGMSGRLMLAEPDDAYPPHTHVVLDLDGDRQLRFVDPRSFGEMFVSLLDGGVPKDLAHLGVDPLAGWPAPGAFARMLHARTGRIKDLLMNQEFIAGLGNIYTDEALHAAGVRYDRPANELSSDERVRLHSAVPQILERAIRMRGTSMQDESYRDLGGLLGGFQDALAVYGREDGPCKSCGEPIVRGRWGNRSTFYCPRCQV
ncbi:MAG: bifunctional DNA-formamidopyrimidine glycosylase/DNA-(apurinic or apyrimidinic site) lyase [Actinomycetota bacterium]